MTEQIKRRRSRKPTPETSITSMTELSNPELEPRRAITAFVEGTETEEQMRARVRREIAEQQFRLQAMEEAKRLARIEERRLREENKHKLDYDLDAIVKWAKEYLAPVGGRCELGFAGVMDGTLHLSGIGKIESVLLAQPEHKIRQCVEMYGRRKTVEEVYKTSEAVSPYTGNKLTTFEGLYSAPEPEPQISILTV